MPPTGHFWIGAAALGANRSALYFGGSGVANDVLKMLAWVAACACLLAVPIHIRGKRRARGRLISPNDHHEQTSWCATSATVAVDGSPDAEQVLTQAVDLAESEHTRLTLITGLWKLAPIAHAGLRGVPLVQIDTRARSWAQAVLGRAHEDRPRSS